MIINNIFLYCAMVERVIDVIKLKAKSVREFAESIGVKQVTLNQQLNGDRKLSLDTILSVLNSFEDISAEWLLRGEGEMYKTVSENKNNSIDESQYVSIKKYERIVNLFGQTAAELKEMALENKMLYDEIRNLKGQLEIAKSA